MNILARLKPFIKEWPIVVILLIGFLMRIKDLTYQSLWLDELHTMNEASPYMGWGEMFHYLKCCDPHPPLYFIIERLSFSIFGHTEYTGRFISVIAGTVSIWAMYFLGKEILNKRLGLIAAVIACINFYNIFYSQEVRPYIFAFLFAALSFAFFIRLIKSPSRKNTILFSLFTLLHLYSHYYSLFVVAAQAALALLFIFQEKGRDRKKLFNSFLLSGIIIGIGYAPWFSHLAATAKIKSFWIQPIAPDFLQNFFYGYFGDAEVLNPLLLLLLFVYVARVSTDTESVSKIRNNPLLLSFTIIIPWVFITLLVPYIRSLTTVPMLFPRYTIVILPAIILALAYGIESFRHVLIKYVILGLFAALSLIHLLAVKKYYSSISKTQFREMTRFVVNNNTSNFPILNEVTSWHQQYYLNRNDSKAEILTGKKESIIDSILARSSAKYSLQGFWLAGAHGDKKPDANTLKNLDTVYQLVKQSEFFDAWASLYVAKNIFDKNFTIIRFDQFEGTNISITEEYVAVWTGAMHSKPVSLPKGKYKLTIRARGDPGGGQFPHVNIYVNDNKAGDYFLTNSTEDKSFNFEINVDTVVIGIEMDNDFFEPGKGDRNVFVTNILIERL